jgi:hypothetical protein
MGAESVFVKKVMVASAKTGAGLAWVLTVGFEVWPLVSGGNPAPLCDQMAVSQRAGKGRGCSGGDDNATKALPGRDPVIMWWTSRGP